MTEQKTPIANAKRVLDFNLGNGARPNTVQVGPTALSRVALGNPIKTKYDSAAYNLAAPKVINNSINDSFGPGVHRTSDLMRARMKADDSIVNPYTGQSGYVYDTSKPFQQFYKDIDKMGLWYDGVTENLGDKLASATYGFGKKKGESEEEYQERVRPITQTAGDFGLSLTPIFGNVTGIGEGFQDMTEAFDGYDRATGQKLNTGQRIGRGGGGLLFALLSAIPGGKALGSSGKLAFKASENSAKLARRASLLEDAAAETKKGKDAVELAEKKGYAPEDVSRIISREVKESDVRPNGLSDEEAKDIADALGKEGKLANRTAEDEVKSVDDKLLDELSESRPSPEEVRKKVKSNENPDESTLQERTSAALSEIPTRVPEADLSRYEENYRNLLQRGAAGVSHGIEALTGFDAPKAAGNLLARVDKKGRFAGRGAASSLRTAVDSPVTEFGRRNKLDLKFKINDGNNPLQGERFADARRTFDELESTRKINRAYDDAIKAALNGVNPAEIDAVKEALPHIANIRRFGLSNDSAAQAAHVLMKGDSAKSAKKARKVVNKSYEDFDNTNVDDVVNLIGENVASKKALEGATRRFFENIGKEDIPKAGKAQTVNDSTEYAKALKELRETGVRSNENTLSRMLTDKEFAKETKGFDAARTNEALEAEKGEPLKKIASKTTRPDREVRRFLKGTIEGKDGTRYELVHELAKKFKDSKFTDGEALEEALDILGPIIPDAAHLNVADLEQLKRLLPKDSFEILFTKTPQGHIKGAISGANSLLYNAGIRGNSGRDITALIATGMSMEGQPYQDSFSTYADSAENAAAGDLVGGLLAAAVLKGLPGGARRISPVNVSPVKNSIDRNFRRNLLPMALKSIADESDRNRYISEDDIMDDAEMNEYLSTLASARDERIREALGN